MFTERSDAGRRLADELRYLRGAPTLLIVGGSDEAVLRLNRQAQQLTCETKLTVIPGASHLFEEPGTLEQVAELAIGWFTRHLIPQAAGTVPPA